MDLKELEAKLGQLETALGAKSGELATALAAIEKLTSDNKELAEANKKLDKDLTIAKENAEAEKAKVKAEKDKAVAGAIMDKALAESSLSEKIQAKIRKAVVFGDYKTDGGEFDKDAFAVAVAAEVKDYEDSLISGPAGPGLGAGAEKEVGDIVAVPHAEENDAIIKSVVG